MSRVISATSEDKNETYELLVAIHSLAVQLPGVRKSQWYISSSSTDTANNRHVTVVSNGKVEVEANSVDGLHRYEKRPVRNDTQN